ncbi:alpha/beta fold hydrolase [Streptomyces syringium]|uniref:Pimeloyl-ACP methyl ester carboxylesterase n=1 Tax=Streptomyces syringium TaxID=76729 RepID=A0ABS4XVN0_9ACTN|nr:alpha/beta fold hydrolase [Streptomyces syringium]MBP2400570.1 pimeloyl-ACP methyl ester carboxylesterase [Streptomyces syringium]
MVDHRSVETGAVRLAYRVSGQPDAPPLVLLHALGENAADWDAVAPAFARHRRVFALDLRGHGRSDWPGDYSLELMQGDVIRFLDVLGLGQVDLIGHSMGGIVAYLLAGNHPQRVRRLVLEDVPVPPQDGIAELARRVPAGRVITIPVGHLVHRAAPETFTEAALAFLLVKEGRRRDRRQT